MPILQKITRQWEGHTDRISGPGWQKTNSATTDLLPTSFTDNDTYLVIVSCGWMASENGVRCGWRLEEIDNNRDTVGAGDQFPDSVLDYEHSDGTGTKTGDQCPSSIYPVSYFTIWTATPGSGLGIKCEPQPTDPSAGTSTDRANNECILRHPTIQCINISSLTDGTHYHYESTNTPTTSSASDHVQLNWTPSANETWLKFTYSRIETNSTSDAIRANFTSTDATLFPTIEVADEGERPPDIISGSYCKAGTYGGSPTAQTEAVRMDATDNAGRLLSSKVLMLNLDIFSHASTYYAGSFFRAGSTTNYSQEAIDGATLSADPDIAGIVLGGIWIEPRANGRGSEMAWASTATGSTSDFLRDTTGGINGPGDLVISAEPSDHLWASVHDALGAIPAIMIPPDTLTLDNNATPPPWYFLHSGENGSVDIGYGSLVAIALDADVTNTLPITLTAASTTDAPAATVKRVTDITMTAASSTDASTAVVTALRGVTHTAASTTDASTVTVDAIQAIPITLTAASTTDASTVDVDSIRNLTLTAASTTDAPAPVVQHVAQVSLTAASTTDASTVTVDTGGEVTPVGWIGTAVGERTFRQQNAWDPSAEEWSAICYNETRDHLLSVADGPAEYWRLSPTTGAIVGGENNLITWQPGTANNTADIEGIVWLGPDYKGNGPDWYALLHEGGTGATNYVCIGIVQILVGRSTAIDNAAMDSEHDLTSIPRVDTVANGIGGAGAEGLSYDRNNDIFWVGSQVLGTTYTGHGLWKVDPNDSWSHIKVFDWADKINEANVTNGVANTCVVGDIHHCALFDGDSIIVSTRGSEPTDNRAEFPNRRWFQLDLTTGNQGDILRIFDYSPFIQDSDGSSATNFVGSGRTPQVEGFCMSDDGETVFMCRENNTDAGNGIFRIESETIGTDYTLITKGEDGWYYWDRQTNHFDASPAWNATNFDIDANANFMGPNQAGFGHVRDPLNVEGTATTSPPSGPIINTDTSGHNSEQNVTVNAQTYYFVKEVWVPAGNIKECLIKAFVDDAAIIYCDGTEVFRTHLYAGVTAAHDMSTAGNEATGTIQEGRQETNDGLIVSGGTAGIARPDTRTTIGSNFTTGAWNRIAALSGSNAVSSSDQFFDLQIELTYYLPLTMTAASSTDASSVTVDATSSNIVPITFTAATTTDASTVDVDLIRPIVHTAASTTDASAAVVTRVEEIAHTAASTTDAATVDVDSLLQIAMTAASTTDASSARATTTFDVSFTAASTTDANAVLPTRTFAVTFTAESTTDSEFARVTRTFDISSTSASTTDASSALLTRLFEIAHTAASTTDASTVDVDVVKPISFTAASTTDAAAARLTRTFSVAFTAASTTDAGAALLSIARAIQLLAESETDAAAAVVDRLATIVHTAASTTDASTANVNTSKDIFLTAASTTDAGAAVVQRLTEILHTAASTTDAPDAVLTRILDIAHTAESTTDADPATISTGLKISLIAATTTDAQDAVVTTVFDISFTAASTTDTATVDVDLSKNITMTAASTTDANTIPIVFGIDFTAASTTDSSSADVDSIRPIAFTAASTTDADSIGIVRGYELTAASSTDAGTATVVSLIGISHVAASTTDASTVGVTSLESITFTAASTTDAATVGLTVGQAIDIMFTAASTTDAPSATIVRVFDVALTGASTTDASSVPIIEGKQVLDDVSSGIDDNVGLVDVGATVLETPVIVDQPGTSSRTGSVLDTLTIIDTPIKTDLDIIEIEDMPGRTPRGWFQTKQGGEQWTVFEHRTSLTDPLVGKTIFRKAINFGALLDSNTKTVVHGIQGLDVDGWVRINGIVRGGNQSEELTGHPNVTRVFVDSGVVSITTDADLTGKTAVVLLEYTKA